MDCAMEDDFLPLHSMLEVSLIEENRLIQPDSEGPAEIVQPGNSNSDHISLRDDDLSEAPQLTEPRSIVDVDDEELEFYNSFFRDVSIVRYIRIHCTICDVHIGTSPQSSEHLFHHRILRVTVCQSCYTFYGSGDFPKGEDGSDIYCRWCGQGGQLLLCSVCTNAFCKKCIKRNYTRKLMTDIENSPEWLCLVCNNTSLWEHRALCRAANSFIKLEKETWISTQRKPGEMYGPEKPVPGCDECFCCKLPPITWARNLRVFHSGMPIEVTLSGIVHLALKLQKMDIRDKEYLLDHLNSLISVSSVNIAQNSIPLTVTEISKNNPIPLQVVPKRNYRKIVNNRVPVRVLPKTYLGTNIPVNAAHKILPISSSRCSGVFSNVRIEKKRKSDGSTSSAPLVQIPLDVLQQSRRKSFPWHTPSSVSNCDNKVLTCQSTNTKNASDNVNPQTIKHILIVPVPDSNTNTKKVDNPSNHPGNKSVLSPSSSSNSENLRKKQNENVIPFPVLISTPRLMNNKGQLGPRRNYRNGFPSRICTNRSPSAGSPVRLNKGSVISNRVSSNQNRIFRFVSKKKCKPIDSSEQPEIIDLEEEEKDPLSISQEEPSLENIVTTPDLASFIIQESPSNSASETSPKGQTSTEPEDTTRSDWLKINLQDAIDMSKSMTCGIMEMKNKYDKLVSAHNITGLKGLTNKLHTLLFKAAENLLTLDAEVIENSHQWSENMKKTSGNRKRTKNSSSAENSGNKHSDRGHLHTDISEGTQCLDMEISFGSDHETDSVKSKNIASPHSLVDCVSVSSSDEEIDVDPICSYLSSAEDGSEGDNGNSQVEAKNLQASVLRNLLEERRGEKLPDASSDASQDSESENMNVENGVASSEPNKAPSMRLSKNSDCSNTEESSDPTLPGKPNTHQSDVTNDPVHIRPLKINDEKITDIKVNGVDSNNDKSQSPPKQNSEIKAYVTATPYKSDEHSPIKRRKSSPSGGENSPEEKELLLNPLPVKPCSVKLMRLDN